MTCVVFGASGLIGEYLLPHLREQGRRVLAVSRHAHDGDAYVDWQPGSLPDGVPPLPAPVAAIVCLGPLDHFAAWLEHADVSGAPRVVAMSSMSAQTKRDSPSAAERDLAARLRDAERRLLARCQQLGSACTILRATLIYGGPAGSLERLATRARRWHVFPLLRGTGLRQPVHAQDLALAALAALDCPQATGVIEIGGGERMTATAMFARARRQWAPHTLGIPLPRPVCALLATLAGRGRGIAARLDQNLIADNRPLQHQLGLSPRRFDGTTSP